MSRYGRWWWILWLAAVISDSQVTDALREFELLGRTGRDREEDTEYEKVCPCVSCASPGRYPSASACWNNVQGQDAGCPRGEDRQDKKMSAVGDLEDQGRLDAVIEDEFLFQEKGFPSGDEDIVSQVVSEPKNDFPLRCWALLDSRDTSDKGINTCKEAEFRFRVMWLLSGCSGSDKMSAESDSFQTPTRGAEKLVVQNVTRLSQVEWLFDFAIKSKAVLVRNAAPSIASEGVAQCLSKLLKGLRRGKRFLPSNVEQECVGSSEIGLPHFASVASAGVLSVDNYVLSKDIAQGAVISQLGVHKALSVLEGLVEVELCSRDSANAAYYAKIDKQNAYQVEYETNSFHANVARFPEVVRAQERCLRLTVPQGGTLYVPHSQVASFRTVSSSVVTLTRFTDELTMHLAKDFASPWNLLAFNRADAEATTEEIMASKHSMIDKMVGEIGSTSPNISLRGWQMATALRALKRQASPEQSPPRINVLKKTRDSMSISIATAFSHVTQTHDVQIEWRATEAPRLLSLSSNQEILVAPICSFRQDGQLELVGSLRSGLESSRLTISRLRSSTEFAIRARYISKANNLPGAWSEWVVASTLAEGLAAAPTCVVVAECRREDGPACARLSWVPPPDHGGFPIEAFRLAHWQEGVVTDSGIPVVERRRVLGNETFALFHGLRPGRSYRFAVAAETIVGEGSLSEPTKPFTPNGMISSLSLEPHLAAFRKVNRVHDRRLAEEYVAYTRMPGRVEHVLHSGLADNEDRERPVVVLSDTLQHVFVLGNKGHLRTSFAAWAAHHSPKTFDVRAGLVLSQPSDACQPITNGDQARDSVLLVFRGGCPLLNKVKHAAAVFAGGVIVVDTTDACDQAFDHKCSPGADKRHGEGFARHDRREQWAALNMPTLLVGRQAAATSLGVAVASLRFQQ